MAETDSLEIKIKAEAEKAEEALDRLAQKLEIIVSKLGSTERKTKDIGGVKQASKESKSALEDLSNNAKKAMKNVENATKKAEESLQEMQDRIMKSARETVQVKVDLKRPELETKKWTERLTTAQNELNAILASSNALSQSRGIERYSIRIAQAEKALRLLSDAENKRNENRKNDFAKQWEEIQENHSKSELKESGKDLQYYKDQLNWYDANITDSETKGYYNFGLLQAFEQLKEKFPEAKDTIKSYEQLIKEIQDTITDIPFEDPSKSFKEYMDKLDDAQKPKKQVKQRVYVSPELQEGQKFTDDYKNLQLQIEKTSASLDKLFLKKQRFEDTGVDKESQKYKDLDWNINHVTEGYNKLVDSAIDMEESGTAIENMEQKTSGFSDSLLKASEIGKTLANVLRGMGFSQTASRVQSASQNLTNMASGMTEVATTSETAGTAMAGLQTAIPVIGLVLAGVTMLINGLRKVANMISTMVRNVVNFFKKMADGLTNLIKKIFNFGKSGTKSSNKLIRGIQRIFMALASRLRSMAVTAVTDSMSDSFENLQKHSKRLEEQMTKLKVTLQLIGGQFVAAFEPVLNYVLPAVNALANGILSAVNALSQLIAALSGQNTYIKATANMDAFKDSASGASKAQKDLNKQLQSFDELNNITTNDGSKGGSGSGNKDNKGTNYEDADIPENIKKLSEKIKEAWENADFTGIGRIIGDNLSSALDSIDWSEIQEKAKKIGKSLGTLITGFVETPDLANKIGNTIAQAVNTVSYSIGEFLKNTNFESVGKFVGESIKSALDGINWSVVISNGKSLGESLADFLNGLFDTNTFASVTKTVAKLLNTAFAFLNGFGDTFDFEGFADSIIRGINNGLNTLDVDSFKDGAEKVAKGLGKAINKLFTDKETWARTIGTGADLVNGLVSAIDDFLSEIDWASVSATLFNSITVFIKEVDWKSVGKTFADLLWGAIMTFKTTIDNPLVWAELAYALKNAIIAMLNTLGEDIKKVWTDFWNNLFGEDVDIKDNKNKIKIDVDKPDIKSTIIGAWGEASSWIKTNVKVNPTVNVPDIKSRIVTAWGKAREYIKKAIKFTPVVNIPDIANRLWHGWKTAKEWWAKNVNFTPKISLERGDDTIANKLWLAWEAAKSWWRRNVSTLIPNIGVPDILGRIRQAWNNAMGWIQQNLILRFHVEFSTPANIIQRAVVRAFGLSGWPKLRFYKNGGFPDMGDLFVANEAGPELVGTANGKSAVASNNEITGIRDAIYDSSRQELAMLRRQNDLLMQIVQKEFGITDSDIFDSVRRSNRQYYNRTGNNALLI